MPSNRAKVQSRTPSPVPAAAVSASLQAPLESHPAATPARVNFMGVDATNEDVLVGLQAQARPTRNRIETRLIPEPKPWGRTERVGYGLHAMVWWVRRVTFERSRDADSVAVKSFLIKKKLWKERGEQRRLSVKVLLKSDIEREFWWINQDQITRLSDMINAFAERRDKVPSDADLDFAIKSALFVGSAP